MRVIQLVSGRQPGGRPRFAADLSRRLQTDGINVIVITRGVREVDLLFSGSGIEIRHLPFGGGWDIFTPLVLARWIRHIPDRQIIIHTYSLADARTALRARHFADPQDDKQISVICDSPVLPPTLILHDEDLPDMFICHGAVSSEKIRMLYGEKCPPVNVIPLAVNQSSSQMTRSRQAGEPGVLRLLFIGYLTAGKGLLNLLEALGKIKNDNWHLTVCGVGKAGIVAPMLKAVKRLGIDKNISWTGEVNNPEDYILNSDVAILPYISPDVYSHSVAMAADLAIPVITTSGGDRAGRIHHGVNGIIIPPQDNDVLACEIENLLDDPTRLESLRNGANVEAGGFPAKYAEILSAYKSLF